MSETSWSDGVAWRPLRAGIPIWHFKPFAILWYMFPGHALHPQYIWQNGPHSCFYWWDFGNQRYDWFYLWIILACNKEALFRGRCQWLRWPSIYQATHVPFLHLPPILPSFLPHIHLPTHLSIHSPTHSVFHLFNKHILSICHVSGSVLGPEDTTMNKTGRYPILRC